jgi:coproporphyrinogen III oxidase-like Fe-S oxidoreductase
VTVECNPTSLDGARALALRDVGVNRLSIGTQALRKEQLEFLGRLHDPNGAIASVRGAIASGMPRVSTDMIFGLPGQSPDDARAQAEELADLGLSHLSCYQLTIEAGTRFGELAKRGRLPLADDGLVADAFLAIDEALGARGLAHYEISNYARPGEEARHNLGYWKGDEYLGLGCGAYGFVRVPPNASGCASAHDLVARAVRYRNAVDPRKYMKGTRAVRAGVPAEDDGLTTLCEALDGETMLRERIMLGLRLARGLDFEQAARDLGVRAWTDERLRAAERLEKLGRLTRTRERTFIPRDGWIWADDTSARLF